MHIPTPELPTIEDLKPLHDDAVEQFKGYMYAAAGSEEERQFQAAFSERRMRFQQLFTSRMHLLNNVMLAYDDVVTRRDQAANLTRLNYNMFTVNTPMLFVYQPDLGRTIICANDDSEVSFSFVGIRGLAYISPHSTPETQRFTLGMYGYMRGKLDSDVAQKAYLVSIPVYESTVAQLQGRFS